MSGGIRPFDWPDYDAVIEIWRAAPFGIGPSETRDGISLRLERDAELFLVAEDAGVIVGAVLGAFDGRRGWINHLAVRPDQRQRGIGTALLAEVERRLRDKGCLKVNLHVESDNADVAMFYERLGYRRHPLLFMEKWLPSAVGLPSPDWKVRRAEGADAEAVKNVAAAAWRGTYPGLLRAETIEAFLAGPYALENVRDRIATHDFLVAEGQPGIVAYADAVPESERIFLTAIYALPANRGQGAGTALLNAIASQHAKLPIDAYVLLNNRKGEVFYERRGFVPEETVDGELFGEVVRERRWRRPPANSRRRPSCETRLRLARPGGFGRAPTT